MRSRRDGVLLISAILSLVSASCALASEPLAFEAVVITAGPYGQLWHLDLVDDTKLSLKITYMLGPMGEMSGRFLLSDTGLADVRRVIADQRFMELPESLWPDRAPFHRPDLRLTVTLGGKSHKVTLYDPDQFVTDERAHRFLAVWREVFALVPLRPAW